MKSFSTFVMMPFGANNEYIDGPAQSDYIFKEIIEPGERSSETTQRRIIGQLRQF